MTVGVTHFNRVSGENGLYSGPKGSEVQNSDASGNLFQAGTQITSTAAELNKLDGVTATAAQLNFVAGVTAGTAAASKAVVLDASSKIDTLDITTPKIGGTAVTSSAAELNLIDGSTAGTAVASKALVLGADKNVDTIAVADGGLKLGAGAGTAVTSTAAELNILDGVTATFTELNLLAGKTSNYNIGTIQLPLADAREIATNDTINAAGNGGLLASDSTPALARVNGATDKALRLTWAASNSDEIQWQVVSPQDLDDTAAVTVYLTMAMAGATNTPTVAVDFFEGIGDTNAGGNTTALSSTPTDKSVVIAAGDIAAANQAWNISIIPGAHTTDAMYLYAAWIEYARK